MRKINKIVYIQVKTDSQNTPDVDHGTSPGMELQRKASALSMCSGFCRHSVRQRKRDGINNTKDAFKCRTHNEETGMPALEVV